MKDNRKLLMKYESYGFQSNEVKKARKLIEKMTIKGSKVVLAFTGNIISSDLRKIVCKLVKNEKVAAIITNGAGIEEDLIKTFGEYSELKFSDLGKNLKDKKIYRIGNLGVKYNLYDKFDNFLEKNYQKVILGLNEHTPGEIGKKLALLRNNHQSFLYWADKKNINVYCPTFHDGAFGDFFIKYRKKNINYRIDYLLENVKLNEQLNSYKDCGVIILGGGTSKHFTLNSSIDRGGFDWSIIISTAIPYDGSDSGGNCEEAISWRKLKENENHIHIYSEATLVFPLIIKKTLLRKKGIN